jgi:small subunit ribosomal protein S20
MKRVRQTNRRTARNVRVKRSIREATKALQTAIDAKQTAKLPDLMSELTSRIDTAVKKNILPKNRAARMKSRYATMVKQAGGKVASGTKKKNPSPSKKPATKKTTTKKPAAKKPARKTTTKK